MKLIITIDTEEDNWGQYNLTNYEIENIKKIDLLQDLLDQYKVKPTYLVTYPVTSNEDAVNLLKRIMEDDRCEIGTHCHPWNTPPFEEVRNQRNSMLCNLLPDLQERKIRTLHNLIIRQFGVQPTSFRAGRWGYNDSVSQILERMGYIVDSSIMAFQSWEDYGGLNYSDVTPHPFCFERAVKAELYSLRQSPLVEIPATVGFAQKNFPLYNRVWQLVGGRLGPTLRLRGILKRMKILNKIWLSPEKSNSKEMISLTTTMLKQGYKIVNMFFHSTSLMAGFSPFVKTKNDEQEFFQRIEEYMNFVHHAGIGSATLTEAASEILE